MMEMGTVYLVGAGPGSQDLLTVRALRLIETADAIVYDRLVSDEILDLIPAGVARFDVGKRPGSHPVPQDSINSILIKLAHAQRTVVRLKGGDPMIFGRGGEEVQALVRAGITVKTVPGITAAQGCAASLNLPLTQRGIADSLFYMTGHTMDGVLPNVDWSGVTSGQTTLVIYMGCTNISSISEKLSASGLPGKTPAMAICNGTRSNQKTISTRLSRLVSDFNAADFNGPVLFIIGEAVRYAPHQALADMTVCEEQSVALGF